MNFWKFCKDVFSYRIEINFYQVRDTISFILSHTARSTIYVHKNTETVMVSIVIYRLDTRTVFYYSSTILLLECSPPNHIIKQC